MSIISLFDATLTIARDCLLSEANLMIQKGDRIALVGRNGAGKSTLLKLFLGQVTLDSGRLQQQAGLRVSGLTQDVPLDEHESVYHFLVKGLGPVGEVMTRIHELSKVSPLSEIEQHELSQCHGQMEEFQAWDILPKVDIMASRLNIATNLSLSQLSGGMKRRVLLAAALLSQPDLLLLDEPTNHLDLETIEWLEAYLKNFPGTVIVVTHDRAFLKAVTKSIVEIDRGKLYEHHCDYERYLDRRETLRQSEQKQHDLFDKKLMNEEAWIRTGIKARRTRNEGRVRALQAMREQYKARRVQQGGVKSMSLDVQRSGRLVLEAEHIQFSFGPRKIIDDLSLVLMKGDKIGIIGPNGCGKTTLIQLLLQEIKPDSGSVHLGTSLEIAYFDQLRRQLEEEQTVRYNVADGADYVTINGKQKHVVSYLSDFLFSAARLNQPVSCLSGGERNRLLLAKLFAKPVNLLVMDEPTNDLDLETLELLEQILLEYSGTLILVSHDRDFINQVVTSVLVYEGGGTFNEYVGGYDEYQIHHKNKLTEKKAPAKSSKSKSEKRSFKEQQELTTLPKKIEELEAAIALMQTRAADPDFYREKPEDVAEYLRKLSEKESSLEACYKRWEFLEGK